MTQYKFTIRKEMPKDYAEVENLVREAFWDVYAPGCDEHLIVHKLRGKNACLADLSCVAVDENGRIVGQILYTKARIEHSDGKQWETAAFGPLGVLPEWQGRGVGGALVRHTLELAGKAGWNGVFITGNPKYYHRFGFKSAQEFGVQIEDVTEPEVQMAIELQPNGLKDISGVLHFAPEFQVDSKELEEFEKNFPHKEKRKTEK